MHQKFKLKFLGTVYELKGEDPHVDLQEVASYVERKAGEIEKKHAHLPPTRLMVLIAMSLGRDYMVLKKRLAELEEKLNLEVQKLSKKIKSELVKKND